MDPEKPNASDKPAVSRFESLEFDEPRDGGARDARPGDRCASTGTPVRDARYFERSAAEHLAAGRLEAALRDCSKALECDSTLFRCWLAQVRILIRLGEYKEADLWAAKTLELYPEHPELLAARAVACARMGLLDKALAYSDNAMSRKGATSYVWLARADVLLARRSRTAGHCIGQAMAAAEGEGDRAAVRIEAARTLRHYRRYTEALLHAREAIATLAGEAAAWLELGLCQSALGLPEAAGSLEQALQLNPGSSAASRAMAALDGAGPWRRAKRVLRRLFRR